MVGERDIVDMFLDFVGYPKKGSPDEEFQGRGAILATGLVVVSFLTLIAGYWGVIGHGK